MAAKPQRPSHAPIAESGGLADTYLNNNETIIDLVQYEPMAQSVVAWLRNAHSSPITIGVHGDWDAGNPSVLAVDQEDLNGSPKTRCHSRELVAPDPLRSVRIVR